MFTYDIDGGEEKIRETCFKLANFMVFEWQTQNWPDFLSLSFTSHTALAITTVLFTTETTLFALYKSLGIQIFQ